MISKELEEKLIANERSILAALKRRDPSAVATALADGFYEIGKGGKSYSKAEIMNALKDPAAITDYSLEQFRLLRVSASCMIVTYIATVRRRLQGKEEVTRAYRSSTWIEQAGSWRMIFHQGTPITRDSIL
ncbi:MAG TPA: nuclear transport factor 2 family protein [Terriglobales bacterium]|jgi:glyoxylase I family protein|nr:nuclear transport factor 2 family protein [Terriglobales bacterium]